ncbi:MAG: aspartyl protease family protein [Candidatus Thermoplasmatota archaeon]|nr:aspartyl protease family protein [Candidatus Thermoplasmatota archaeon]
MTDTFEYIEGHILFEIDVDGKPARVIFDTGAGLSIMDKRFCDKHDISVSGEFTVPNAMGDFVTLQLA